jgi:hypothetical protein
VLGLAHRTSRRTVPILVTVGLIAGVLAGSASTADAATCQNMAVLAAQTIVARWNSYHGTLGYIPALLDGSGDRMATQPR